MCCQQSQLKFNLVAHTILGTRLLMHEECVKSFFILSEMGFTILAEEKRRKT